MLKDGENGYIYQDGNTEELAQKTACLLRDEKIRRDMAQKAYATVHDLWNGKVAAQRLVQLIDALEKQPKAVVFDSGPCSPAPVLRDDWFRN
jgi:glycosyltransferase involved in cell wall biosynthesis